MIYRMWMLEHVITKVLNKMNKAFAVAGVEINKMRF